MFSNLNAEMGRAKLSIKSLSELTGINYETLKLKFRGVTEFKLCEMVEIKRKAFPDKTLDYLFATDETGSEEGREQMKSEDERKWFEFHEIQPELAELYRYFDRTVLCYRIIIAVLLGIIAILLLK